MLPDALQTRLFVVPSLRRTLSDYGIRSEAKEPASATVLHRRSESTDLVFSQTSSSKSSAEMKGKLSQHGMLCHNPLPSGSYQGDLGLNGDDRLPTTSSIPHRVPVIQSQSSSPSHPVPVIQSQSSSPDSRLFSRQLYLDSMANLLQGLPSNLSDHEALLIQKSFPPEVKIAPLSIEEGGVGGGGRLLLGRQQQQQQQQQQQMQSSKPPSILHRSLASTIILLCVIFRVFWPYVRYWIGAAYRYDREHHVSDKFWAKGLQTTDALGKRALEVASSALGSEFAMEVVGYCVEGVCGGVSEGLGRGVRAIEER